MFHRAAKLVVKSLGSCRIHIDRKNYKLALIDGGGEISQTLSQLLKNSVKLNTLALYDVAAVNRPLPNYNFFDEQAYKPIPSEMLTMTKESCSGEGSRSNAAINSARQTDDNNHQGSNERSQTEKLVEALYRLPIAEEAPAFNSPLIPIEEITTKAGNACGRMRLYARVLDERGSSGMETWQRDYATVPIRKWFSDLTYPPFQEYGLNFIPEVKIVKKHRSIKKTREIKYPSCSVLVAKENNYQSLPTSLLNYDEKSARRLTKKFRNVGVSPNNEARCRAAEKSHWLIPAAISNNKLRLIHGISGRANFSLSSLNFASHKRENNGEVVPFSSNSETMTHDTLNVVEQENWIQRAYSKIKSILPDLYAKIRLHSTTASGSYCSENIFAANQVIPFSDIISNSAILFASKDCEDKPKFSIRKKIQEFCMQRKGSLKKNRDKNDICKKREKCNATERKCQTREKICKRKKIDCSERRKRTCRRQSVVSCEGRKSSCGKRNDRDCRKICERKMEAQEEPCKRKKADTSRTEEAPCGQRPMKQEQTFHKMHDTDPCRGEKKEQVEKEEIKKEEIKKPEIKKVDPCEKKTCPTVKKIPECSESGTKGKSS